MKRSFKLIDESRESSYFIRQRRSNLNTISITQEWNKWRRQPSANIICGRPPNHVHLTTTTILTLDIPKWKLAHQSVHTHMSASPSTHIFQLVSMWTWPYSCLGERAHQFWSFYAIFSTQKPVWVRYMVSRTDGQISTTRPIKIEAQ